MWEKFKEWFLSDNMPWFVLGFELCNFLDNPSLINMALVAFWIWVLSLDE